MVAPSEIVLPSHFLLLLCLSSSFFLCTPSVKAATSVKFAEDVNHPTSTYPTSFSSPLLSFAALAPTAEEPSPLTPSTSAEEKTYQLIMERHKINETETLHEIMAASPYPQPPAVIYSSNQTSDDNSLMFKRLRERRLQSSYSTASSKPNSSTYSSTDSFHNSRTDNSTDSSPNSETDGSALPLASSLSGFSSSSPESGYDKFMAGRTGEPVYDSVLYLMAVVDLASTSSKQRKTAKAEAAQNKELEDGNPEMLVAQSVTESEQDENSKEDEEKDIKPPKRRFILEHLVKEYNQDRGWFVSNVIRPALLYDVEQGLYAIPSNPANIHQNP